MLVKISVVLLFIWAACLPSVEVFTVFIETGLEEAVPVFSPVRLVFQEPFCLRSTSVGRCEGRRMAYVEVGIRSKGNYGEEISKSWLIRG